MKKYSRRKLFLSWDLFRAWTLKEALLRMHGEKNLPHKIFIPNQVYTLAQITFYQLHMSMLIVKLTAQQ